MKIIDYSELTSGMFRREYFDEFTPVLIKNGVKEFEKVSSWNIENIKNRYPGVICNYSDHSRPASSRMQTTYLDYFDSMADKYYVFSRRDYVKGRNDPFIEDFHIPNMYFDEEIARHIFFTGPSLTGALPHKHGDAINFLVSGRKRWVIFDARTGTLGNEYQLKYYKDYPEGRYSMEWFTKEYPLLLKDSRIEIHECIQEDGDVVYVPNGFSHSTFNTKYVLGIVTEVLRNGEDLFL